MTDQKTGHAHKHSKIASTLPLGEQRIMSIVPTHARKNKTQMINGTDGTQEPHVTLRRSMVRQTGNGHTEETDMGDDTCQWTSSHSHI